MKIRLFFLSGLTLVCIGVAGNEWLLTKAFSADGVLEPITRITIWVFDITCTLIGSAFIRYREIIRPRESFLRLSQSHPRILAFSIGIIFAVVILLCAEKTLYILNSYRETPIITARTTAGDFLRDEVLGYKPWPKTQFSTIKRKREEIIYNVIYSTDAYSRRVTPMKDPEGRMNFLLFFGCSFTFGEGLNDDETLPFYVSEFAPQYRPYNYGYSGYGPQNMLAKLQSGEISKETSETQGMAIYTFIDHHIHRVIGTMQTVTRWAAALPFYTLDAHGRLVRQGSMTSGRPLLSFLYPMISESQIVRYFKVDFPLRINENHIKITLRIIEEARNNFIKEFHSEDFYVLFFPGSIYAKKMIPYFERDGIKYLDYSSLVWWNEAEYYIEDDGHPNAKANRALAGKLARDLRISSNNGK